MWAALKSSFMVFWLLSEDEVYGQDKAGKASKMVPLERVALDK